MDKATYVDRRKGKYMAQTLESFEDLIEPLLPKTPDAQRKIADFKGLCRARFNALKTDAVEIMSLSDEGGLNAVAIEQRDALSPTGRP